MKGWTTQQCLRGRVRLRRREDVCQGTALVFGILHPDAI
jgi:hypothetical protein